ncbi:MAG: hypothetical protein ACLR4X_12100 [Clostridia bacterium]
MNKQDLKNGMIYKIRNGLTFYIILDSVYKLNNSNNTEMGTLNDILIYYNDDLTYKGTKWGDIMIVRDVEGNLLWEREEVESEQKEYTFDEVEYLFEEYCNKFDDCNKCKYSGDCRENWKNDNFTITRK